MSPVQFERRAIQEHTHAGLALARAQRTKFLRFTGKAYERHPHRRTRPATARTRRGAANHIAPADSALPPMAIQKAGV